MTATAETLDHEELLHLAIHASQNSQTEQAIDYLKRSLDLSPENGQALYLLGSLHAEIGLYERAIGEIEQAVSLAPEIETAHFQLGLLYVTLADVEKAKKAWEKLDHLNKDHYLYLFKDGITTLLDDDFEGCIKKLKQGIMNNDINPPLNGDMLKLIQATEHAKHILAADGMQDPNAINTQKTGKQVVLSAYNNNLDN